MSHKLAKQARKQIKNYLREKDQNTMNNQQKVEYTFAQLQQFINLSVFLTGKKPEKIELVEAYYNWYRQEAMNQAEALGLKTGFKDDKITFMGILLEKKINIVVPEVVVPNAVNGGKEVPKIS